MINYNVKSCLYRDLKQIDKDWKKVVVNLCGEIINENPTIEELENMSSYPGRSWNNIKNLSDKKEYLLKFVRWFYEKEKRVPEILDFNDNLRYPSFNIYLKVFKSWNNAIRDTGLQPNWGGKGKSFSCTDEELLMYIIQFYEKNGKTPTEKDFTNNPTYPGYSAYQRRFGGLENASKLIDLDIDSMVRRGVIKTCDQKARLSEILILEHFPDKNKVIDLAGEKRSYHICDGVCPNGENYDVKVSIIDNKTGRWLFHLNNVNMNKIDWFYLIAFNVDYTELLYTWRIPSIDFIESIDKKRLYINMFCIRKSKYSVKNMRKYQITEKVKPVFQNWIINIKPLNKEEILNNAKKQLEDFINGNREN